MNKKKKYGLTALGLLAVVAVIITGVVFAAPGVVPGPNFEIDGNTAQDNSAHEDWESVILGDDPDWDTGPGYLIRDGSSGPKATIPELNIFAKGGKFADPTTWTIEPGNTPAQNDLTNIYIYPVIEGADGHVWMVMGMERIKKQGTFDLDFEYNQTPWDGTSENLQRTDGDIVVAFELSGNPDDPQADLEVLILVYKPTNPSCSGYPAIYGGGFCEVFRGPAEALGTFGEATMNAVEFPQPPWGSFASSGAPLPEGSNIQPFFFAEAAIDLTELGIEPGCPGFGTVHAKSRSSLEITADLKDLVGPLELPVNCYIEGYKYLDVNGNGDQDEGEPGLADWVINLGGDSPATTTTDADGYYRFDNLADGAYTVTEVCPVEDPPWVQTEPGASITDDCGDEIYNFTINLDNRIQVGDFGNGAPDIAVTKTCSSAVFVGDDIDYTITASNPGEVDLVNVSVYDSVFGELGPIDLDAGQSEEFKPSRTATSAGSFTNKVDVSGEFGGTTVYATVSDSAECTTEVYELTVTKTADEFYKRYFEWDITKSVTPAAWALFTGETGTSEYTVFLDKTGYYENDWQVKGGITISNPAPMDASLSEVTDDAGGIAAAVTCPSLTVPAEGSLVCSYNTGAQDFKDANPFGETNTATATLNNNNGGTTDFTGTSPIDFSEATVELVDEEATVSDTYSGSTVSGTYTDDKTFTYTRDFTCDGDEGENSNIASFETNDTPLSGEDDAKVDVSCYKLSVTKDADEFYSRYFEWKITKSVEPAAWDLFIGESGTSDYTVALEMTGFYENDWRVEGTITINNPHPTRQANLTSVIDDAGGVDAVVDCSTLVVPAGSSITCDYNTGAQDAVDDNPFGAKNTATATQQLYDFDKDLVWSYAGTATYSGEADINFDEAQVELVDEEATVSDTYPDSTVEGTYTDDKTFTYSRTFTCDADEGKHDNTASFETNDTPLTGSDGASVQVNCYGLEVSKDADEFYTRYYTWEITKVVDNPGPISVPRGGSVEVEYTIVVDVLGYMDNDWQVKGSITVKNNNPNRDADLTGVIDNAGGITAAVSCPSLIVPAGGSLACTYDSGVQDSENLNPFGDTNTATATQQLYIFASDGTASADGTAAYSGTWPIDFGQATVELIDEQVTVEDSYEGYLGTATTNEAPKTFTYTRIIDAPDAFCGELTVDNTATFTTIDTGTKGSDDASVIINVPCEGCTPGFWRGGAGAPLWDEGPPDDDWTGEGNNPFIHTTLFNVFFGDVTDERLDGQTMFQIVSNDSGIANPAERAARTLVAAYLNESAFPDTFPAESLDDLVAMWYAAVEGGDDELDAFHRLVGAWNDPSSIGGYCPLP